MRIEISFVIYPWDVALRGMHHKMPGQVTPVRFVREQTLPMFRFVTGSRQTQYFMSASSSIGLSRAIHLSIVVIGSSQSYGPNRGTTATFPAFAAASTFSGLEYVLKLGPRLGSQEGFTRVTTNVVLVSTSSLGPASELGTHLSAKADSYAPRPGRQQSPGEVR